MRHKQSILLMRHKQTVLLRFTALILSVCLLVSGCHSHTAPISDSSGEIVIPALFLVNPETGIADNKDIVEDFNKAYEGTYRVEVEWMTETVEGYRARLKQLNAQDKLPALITDVGMDEDFYRLLVDNDRLVELSAYMDGDWSAMIDEDVLADCTEDDGSIYMSPIVSPIYSYSGIIYNRQLLARAGYDTVPADWEGFYQCLADLETHQITPLALHGGGTFWSSMLLSTAYCGRSGSGARFLQEQFPQDYDNASMRELLFCLDKVYDYTYPDAMSIDYTAAQTRFFNGEAAMLINGYWAFESMDEEQQEMYGFVSFPGQLLIASPKMTAWAATTGYDSDVTRGTIALLRYRVECSKVNSEKFLQSEGSAIMQDYKAAVSDMRRIMPNYQLKWEQGIQNEFFNEYIPLFINEEIGAEEFIQALNQKAKQIRAEKEN